MVKMLIGQYLLVFFSSESVMELYMPQTLYQAIYTQIGYDTRWSIFGCGDISTTGPHVEMGP